ncbi:hypothetical protein C8Q73DRAFT_785196 [Cubamyces lactineus]|nr:hypothetical protein C8Q73DRAFT_785196 [Cubamyces lactineus]
MDPSSRESSPETFTQPQLPPSSRSANANTPKPDKGKKRAADAIPGSSAKKVKGAKMFAPVPAPRSTAKGKGKQVAKPLSNASHTGRQPGASNYTNDDIHALLDLVEEELPIGQTSWQRITDRFNNWARDNGRPPRTHKPLKTKYDGLVRTPKPTGSASVPPNVVRAWEIKEQINERIHLGVLDDAEIVDMNEEIEERILEVDENSDDLDIEVIEQQPASSSTKSIKVSSTRKPATQPVVKVFCDQAPSSATRSQATSNRRAQAQEFMSAVTASLNPATRDARDDARFARKLAQDELTRLSQDNHDLRSRNETLADRLHQQSMQLQQQLSEIMCFQARVDMLEMMQGMSTPVTSPLPSLSVLLTTPPCSRTIPTLWQHAFTTLQCVRRLLHFTSTFNFNFA